MRDGFISMGHGRAIINVASSQDQLNIYEKILREKLSVRQTEELVKSLKTGTIAKPKKKQLPKFVKESLKDISEYFGHKIDVTVKSNGKGKLSIPFHSEEDFNRIKNLLK
jgi:ParB family chromosome partitioning protein